MVAVGEFAKANVRGGRGESQSNTSLAFGLGFRVCGRMSLRWARLTASVVQIFDVAPIAAAAKVVSLPAVDPLGVEMHQMPALEDIAKLGKNESKTLRMFPDFASAPRLLVDALADQNLICRCGLASAWLAAWADECHSSPKIVTSVRGPFLHRRLVMCSSVTWASVPSFPLRSSSRPLFANRSSTCFA